MNFKMIYMFLVLLFFQVGFAGETLTLQDAITTALDQNIGIEVARNNARINENNAHIGNAGLLPKVDLQSEAAYSDIENMQVQGMTVDQASTTTSAALRVSYTLFNGMGRIYTYKKLKSLGNLGELSARNNIENIIYAVVQNYYAVSEASENYRIALDALKISEERLKRAENRSKFGQANTLDVLSAKVDYNTDSITVVNSRLALDQTRRNLNTLLNRDGETEFGVEADVQFKMSGSLEQLREQALNKNAAFLIQQESVKQAKYDVKIATSAFSPTVSFQSGYGYSRTEDDLNIALNDPQKSLTAGLSLSFNLFNGFQNSIDRQNAKISEKNEKLLLAQNRLELKTVVANTWQAYQNSLFVLKVQQQNLEVAQLNFKRTEELYQLGQATTTQFREAQLNLNRAKYNISAAKFDAKLNEIELLRLSGGLLEN